MKQDPIGPISDAALLVAIVQSSTDAIITKDLDGKITSWNAAAESLFGYSAAEAVGKPITMLMPDDRLNEEPGILARIRRGERIRHYETVRITKDGRLIDISLTVSPLHNDDGVVIGASKIARDITGRKTAEAQLRRYASIVEFSSDAIISKDLDGVIRSWNRGAEAIFGYTAAEAIGRPGTMLMPADRADEEPGILNRIRRGEFVDHYLTVRRRKDGCLIDISLNVSPIFDAHGTIVGASKIARDVTEHNRLQAAEREAEMMQQLVETQEAERRRIARDLHDHIGQHMTAMRLTLEDLASSTHDGRIISRLMKLKELASRIDSDISFLAWELRPTELEEFGLRDALQSFIKEWSAHSGIEADFDYAGDESHARLSPVLETNLYRITQEALNNIAKHANATHVAVFLHRQRDQIYMLIEDDGRGFDTSAPPAPGPAGHRMGLKGMRERVQQLNGKLLIESSPDSGTTIVVTVATPSPQPTP